MTIESTRAPEGAKTTTKEAGRSTAATGRPGTAGAPAGAGGFADVMSSLAATDAQDLPTDASVSTAEDAPSASTSGDDDTEKLASALDDKGQAAINVITSAVPPVTPALVSGKGTSDKSQTTDKAEAPLATSDVTTLLNSRRVSQSHGAVQAQNDAREARLQPGGHHTPAAPEGEHVATVNLVADTLVVSADRREGKPSGGTVRTGLEGAVAGGASDRLGISPTYDITAASAVVPDTQVAETVSYWATQGVQNAELTLDGLGNEPVEVRISVDGDQAQVDFRSNQPDVRQALEGASAQLRTMLSGEGLQLTGMSVGTSGRGSAQSDPRQPKPAPRQTAVLSMDPVRNTTVRPAGQSVGRALDLYV